MKDIAGGENLGIYEPQAFQEFVRGTSITYNKNPKYWAYDERYPQNRLPYVDTLKTIVIPDTNTMLAALRTGKIDKMSNITWQKAESLKKSNPELVYAHMIQPAQVMCLRSDRQPFSDIRVRIALQLALDLPAISEGYYGGTSGPTVIGLINPAMCPGIAIPYDEWPQELKDEYSYNPERARELLAEAGYPDGLEVTCDIFTGMGDIGIAQIFKDYLEDIGVIINLEPYDMGTMMALISDQKHDDMVQWTTAQTMPPLMGMQMYVTTEPTDVLLHKDTTYDQLVEACLTASTEEEAKQRISAVDQYFLEQHWVTMTFIRNMYIYWQPYLKGYCGEKALTKGYNARYWIDQDLKSSMGR